MFGVECLCQWHTGEVFAIVPTLRSCYHVDDAFFEILIEVSLLWFGQNLISQSSFMADLQRRVVLGTGSGRCGLASLTRLLNSQPGTAVSHEQPPLMPWVPDLSRPGMKERFQRMSEERPHPIFGDTASFYLTYAREILTHLPAARMICLKRNREEVVESFCAYLDKVHPIAVNHWSKVPSQGWFHEPQRTRMYPQYDDVEDRRAGIVKYWNEYYQLAERLQKDFPQSFRIVETEKLSTAEGQTEILGFLGYDENAVVTMPGLQEHALATVPDRRRPVQSSKNPHDPRRCVVLVPYSNSIVPRVHDALKELERRGYVVRLVPGYAAIDQGRNQMATDALIDGFEETMWIDSDVAFHPDSVDRLRSHDLPIVCGIYPQKGVRALASHVMPGSEKVVFGNGGGLIELLYAGTGFLHIRREVYRDIQEKLNLPMCNERFRRPMIPFFLPMAAPYNDGHWYLAEDYAFCTRAKQCGYRIMADTTIRLWHVGTYSYGWEDAGTERERYGTFTLEFNRHVEEPLKPE